MIVYDKQTKIKSPVTIVKIMQNILAHECEIDRDKEHFWTIGLNTNKSIKYIELVSLGSLNSAIVHPREVFRNAISQAVSTIIVCHNHPSGEMDASTEDIKTTERLAEAGKIIGILLLDHIVISKNDYKSLHHLI